MSDDFEIVREEPASGSIMPVRLAGRLHVPACFDCEEPSKCCVFGCGHSASALLARRVLSELEAFAPANLSRDDKREFLGLIARLREAVS